MKHVPEQHIKKEPGEVKHLPSTPNGKKDEQKKNHVITIQNCSRGAREKMPVLHKFRSVLVQILSLNFEKN